ncbi:malonate decarboxylase acyl carrier protein [Alcaligenes nematophilus]|jgi:malonate decarboxylase delta subunit|uniref:Malonate decarboxylase acyl carrier protein n=3 Tax=Alcaligenes TaxID=507 RepID=A0AAE9H960_ALCFA|nr:MULTISPECIES: malonate decarboxylase acyl carrier protein [Alcaligenes]MDH4866188.1 malonate decarboxylase acyl carrier protein [Bacillus cereus]ASC89806.1 malonate decarboxylase acyl carrier protein [Alcaligenes faecalis]EKU30393.1 malonate decarboxylase acyl carrier protein [Alcaligenes sp. HPC1271]ERT55188.1 Malonate decarboxylase acyl carrier protein [Alcaligenes sp. EGD-AK7]KGP01537.1 Malonate decarboxylase acyl carrier protein [Alcaligenes faecalis]
MTNIPHGLETLAYSFKGQEPIGTFQPVLVGVVGSGNLEVLAEPKDSAECTIHIHTSARGFSTIWDAVVRDFHQRHPLAGIHFDINDMGATPAVVSLRLDQAASEALARSQAQGTQS